MSAFLAAFNPLIDRYDRRSAARLFQWLWPNSAVSLACASTLAESIRVAHAATGACWEVTMFPDMLRLNVGQVEALALWADEIRVLVRAPLEPVAAAPGRLEIRSEPAYAAVPVPSGVCFLAADDMLGFPAAVRTAHNAFIVAAASYKRVSPFKSSFSPAVLDYLEVTLGEPLPRPSYLASDEARQRVDPLPDELDASALIYEGAKYSVTVNAYERDPKARRRCIDHYGTDCFICGFSFRANFGDVGEGLIHVHHERPLSEVGEEYQVDPVQDLKPVCPNCHAVLHRRVPAYSVAEVRALLRSHGR